MPAPATPKAPLAAAIIPVTPVGQNCSLIWCTKTMKGAFVDPGGDLARLKQVLEKTGVTLEKILITHGHLDHCGMAGVLAKELGVRIEGPHEADRFWIARFGEDGPRLGMEFEMFEPDRWLNDGDTVTVGEVTLNVLHCPGHTPGHVVYHNPECHLAITGDILFRDSIGRYDFPMSNHRDLIDSITGKLWPLGDETTFLPGHGPPGRFGTTRVLVTEC